MMRDTILRDGVESEAYLIRGQCRYLGDRKQVRVKACCNTASVYLPVYGCQKHRLASPFGIVENDGNLIHSCQTCPDFQRI